MGFFFHSVVPRFGWNEENLFQAGDGLECTIDKAFCEHHLTLEGGGGGLVKWWFMLGWSSLQCSNPEGKPDTRQAWFSTSAPILLGTVDVVCACVCVSAVHCVTGVKEVRRKWRDCEGKESTDEVYSVNQFYLSFSWREIIKGNCRDLGTRWHH